jgi:hypothetical protein
MTSAILRAPLSGALVVLAVACGGPDRPADNPTQGPTGGQSSTDLPLMPSPTPAPGTEPAPAPGGPDTTPAGEAPSTSLLEVRSPLIATALYSEADVYGKAQAGSGFGGAAGGMPGIGGVPGVGGVGGRGR